MLVINKENRAAYTDMLRAIERDTYREVIQKHTDVSLKGMEYTPDGLVSEEVRKEARERAALAVRNFKDAVNDLNFYGDDPRRIRVYIIFNPYDWSMCGVSFWSYSAQGKISEGGKGMPIEEDKWSFMFNGALAFHRSDCSWSVHT